MSYLVRMPGEPPAMVRPPSMHTTNSFSSCELEVLALPIHGKAILQVEISCLFGNGELGFAALSTKVAVPSPEILDHHLPDYHRMLSIFPRSVRTYLDKRQCAPAVTDWLTDRRTPSPHTDPGRDFSVVHRGCPPVITRCHIEVPAGTHCNDALFTPVGMNESPIIATLLGGVLIRRHYMIIFSILHRQ